jgi:hypothetical protein
MRPRPANGRISLQNRGFLPAVCGEFFPDRQKSRRSDGIRPLKGHSSHFGEENQSFYIVRSRRHCHRKIGAGLSNGPHQLAAHLLKPCKNVLYSGTGFRDAMIPPLLASRKRLPATLNTISFLHWARGTLTELMQQHWTNWKRGAYCKRKSPLLKVPN